jgi:ketosteroid isomerase-like protein
MRRIENDSDGTFAGALAAVEAGLEAIGAGDPTLYQGCWADVETSTLYGAWGTRERGQADITATLDWVGSRFSGGTLTPSYEVIHVGADVAYTVGVEQGNAQIDAADSAPVTIRVTHVFRKFPELGWKLVHRHADHPPTLAAPPRI